jgi:hypothetical protein
MPNETVQALAPIIISLIGAVVSYVSVRSQWRKIAASSRVDEATAADTITKTAISMIDPYEEAIAKITTRLEKAEQRAQSAEDKANLMEQELAKVRALLAEALRENSYSVLTRLLSMPVFLVEADTWVIKDANFAAAYYYQYSRPEFIDMCYLDLIQDRSAMETALRARIDSIQSIHIRKDNTTFSACVRAAFYSQGTNKFCITLTEDISQCQEEL